MVETAIALGLFGVAFVFAYLAVNLKEKHGVLQMFFSALSLFTLAELMSFVAEFAAASGAAWAVNISKALEGFYGILVTVSLVFILYFVVTVITYAVKSITGGERD